MPGSRRASHARGAATALLVALSLAGCQVMAISTAETDGSSAIASSTAGSLVSGGDPSIPPGRLGHAPVPAVSADPSASPPAPSPPDDNTVPILYYHRVQAAPAEFTSWGKGRQHRFLAYDTLPAAFVAQLDWLHDHGFTTILPRDLAAHWDLGTSLPPKPVILTFDDGFPSWVTVVLPALRERGMVAEFYVTLDAIRVGALRWSDVKRLAAEGNGIGAHDVHHVQLAGVPGRRPASRARMRREVTGVRTAIEAHVGVAPDSIAYVGGGFNRTLIEEVRRAGYTTARSVERGRGQSVKDRYALRVVRVGGRDDVLDVVTGRLEPDLPTFTRLLFGFARHSSFPQPKSPQTGGK